MFRQNLSHTTCLPFKEALYWYIGLSISLLYFILAKFGLIFTVVADNVTLTWPPTGLALFCLFVFGGRFWPWIFIGAFLVNLTTGIGIAPSSMIAAGNTLEALLGMYLLRRVNFDSRLSKVRDVIALIILAAGISTMVSATIGALSLTIFNIVPADAFGKVWINWWMGDAMGDLVFAPVFFSWWTGDNLRLRRGRILEAVLLGVSLCGVAQLVFGGHLTLWGEALPLSFMTFPFLIWASLRFGIRGATSVVFVIGTVMLINITLDMGPFARENTTHSLLLLWMYTNFLAITSLVLAAAVTERSTVEEKLRHTAEHDYLTGLPNRIMLNDRINQSIEFANRYQSRFAILFMDVDRFKLINDSLGHTLGDKLLKKISECLQACVRKQDTVSRLGGDEFVVLVNELHRQQDIYPVLNKVLEAVRTPVFVDGKELHITTSIGVCFFPHDGKDTETLLKNADIAMYRAKEAGRDCFFFYSADMNKQAEKRLTLETELHRAISKSEFQLYYQPQFDSIDGEIKSVEALIRWINQDGQCIGPDEFIPVLEETGKIIEVGRWVIEESCRQLAMWHAAGWNNMRVAVNISSQQLNDESIVLFIKEELEKNHIKAEYLELEITESMLVRQASSIEQVFEKLVALGVRLAVDDFGTGYSSLSYLHRLSIDTLKIDRSFVENIPGNENSEAITRAIVGLAKSLKLTLVAEGIETQEQRAFVSDLGCDYLQGYMLSRPVTAEKIDELLMSGASRI